jgi:hypothetical protein
MKDHRGRHRMVVGLTITYAIVENTELNSRETEIMPFNVVMLGRKQRVKQ